MASKHIRLGILDEFKCSGSECPASCCSYGWNIDVDDETYIRWQQADTENRERDLLESLTVKYGTNERRLKHINNQCTHLSDQGLCKVQM